MQGLKKVLSGHPVQVDSACGQVNFTLTCPFGKGPGKFCTN